MNSNTIENCKKCCLKVGFKIFENLLKLWFIFFGREKEFDLYIC